MDITMQVTRRKYSLKEIYSISAVIRKDLSHSMQGISVMVCVESSSCHPISRSLLTLPYIPEEGIPIRKRVFRYETQH